MNSTLEDQFKSLEHSTLRAPYETLNKNFRNTQKHLEKESAHFLMDADDLRSKANENQNLGEIKNMCTSIADRLKQFKRKAEDTFDSEIDAAEACKKRILCLLSLGQLSKDDPTKWEDVRFDRMLVEHLLHNDHFDTAQNLAKTKEVIDMTNFELFLSLRDIYISLITNKDTKKCLEWCDDNKSKLKKINSNLEFTLYQQEFIELVKKDMRVDAVFFARKQLQKFNTSIEALQQTMGLLAYSLNTDVPAYRSLLDENRWLAIGEQFKSDSGKIYNLGDMSRFAAVLQAGMSALKTSSCFVSPELRNPMCPICSSLLNKFAEHLPSAYCAQSKIFCRLSNQPIDENNQPYMLPNGFVYGIVSLKKMAKENNGIIICPRTNQVYTMNDLKRVYIM